MVVSPELAPQEVQEPSSEGGISSLRTPSSSDASSGGPASFRWTASSWRQKSGRFAKYHLRADSWGVLDLQVGAEGLPVRFQLPPDALRFFVSCVGQVFCPTGSLFGERETIIIYNNVSLSLTTVTTFQGQFFCPLVCNGELLRWPALEGRQPDLEIPQPPVALL